MVRGIIRPLPFQATDRPLVDEVEIVAVLDTGASSTMVCSHALAQLGLHCVDSEAVVYTANGQALETCSFLARMDLDLPDSSNKLIVDGPVKSLDDLGGDDECNALIGLDVLRHARWTKEPRGIWNLDFDGHVEN